MGFGINKVFNNIKINFNANHNVSFRGKANNEPQDDTFIKSNIDIKFGLTKDKLSGSIEGMPFELSHKGGFIKSDSITGAINNKDINLNYKHGFLTKDKLSGTIGEKDLNLKISHKFWGGLRIKGTYNKQKIDYNVKEGLLGYRIKGDGTDLQVKGKNIFSNDFAISGKYNDDKELLPILLDVLNIDRQDLN